MMPRPICVVVHNSSTVGWQWDPSGASLGQVPKTQDFMSKVWLITNLR